MVASSFGFEGIVKKLLSHNADIYLKSKHGLTAYDYAKNNNHNTIAELLKEKEINNNRGVL
jgi:ankyrin repeat protein